MKSRPLAVSKRDPIPVLRRDVTQTAAPSMSSVEFFDIDQQSDEWYALRLGMLTASNLGAVMANSDERKMRQKLLYQLAGERLSGTPAETYSNTYMERGRRMEAKARAQYEFIRGVELQPIGFVRRQLAPNRFVGCSPDSFIPAEKRGLEIKTMSPHLMVALIDAGSKFPTEHRAQCHGTLWVTGWDAIDLSVYYDGMPTSPRWTIERSEPYIREIAERAEEFEFDLCRLVERIRK